jgi:DNA modification methylase
MKATWQSDDGSIRLWNADALEVSPLVAAETVAAVITDPPYMLGAASARKSADKAIGWADINNAARWYAEWLAESWRVLRDDGSLWVFANWKLVPVLQCGASKVPGLGILSVIVWDKEWPSVGSMRGLRQNYELVVLFGKPGFAIENRSLGDIWKCKWSGQKPSGHPQEKPVALIERMIEVGKINGLIVDWFCGSGATAEGAVRTGNTFIGCELEEGHVQRTVRRLLPLFANVDAPPEQRSMFEAFEEPAP